MLDVDSPGALAIEIHRLVIDDTRHRHGGPVPEGFSKPGDTKLQRDTFSRGSHNEHADVMAALRRISNQEFMPAVRRIELANHQPVSKLIHAAATSNESVRAS